jgi:phosphoribosylaminoimidazole synthetase
MAGFYRPGEYDVAGFAVGAVSRKHILPRNIQEGDVLLALPSSGVHSNGFSLVRKCVERSGLQWSDQCPFVSESCSLSEVLLSPTKIYVKQLLPLIKSGLLKGMAHITGGGLLDNIPRMLPENLAARLDFPQLLATGWTLPPVFRWLQEIAKLPQDELLRTFNCGVGMVLAVEKSLAASVLAELAQRVQDEELEEGGSSGRVMKSGLPMILGQIVSKPADCSSQVIVIGSIV